MVSTPHAVLVAGGAGYVGAVLVPRLLDAGHAVTVLDRFYFGTDVLAPHPKLTTVIGDIRDERLVDDLYAREKLDTVIHLAAVSNDPGSDIDAEITRTINRVALEHLMRSAKRHGIDRFIYASSASVYGVKEEAEVHEDLPFEPMTLYAKYKAEGEAVLNELVSPDFTGVSVRPGTICGFSPRLRLDLTVNIFTFQALMTGKLRVFGGSQMRPTLHIDDMASFYIHLLDAPKERINGRAFNLCYANATVMELAEMVRNEVDPAMPIDVTPSNDLRSYRLSSARTTRELGFTPQTRLETAVQALVAAYKAGRVPDPSDMRYRNVDLMKARLNEWASARPA